MSADNRVERFWLRLEQRFGDTLGVTYPHGVPARVGDLVRSADNDTVKRVLGNLTSLKKLPSIREMELAFGALPIEPRTNPMPALVAYIMRTYRLTEYQTRTPWTWLAAGDPRTGSQNFAIMAVRVPDDPDTGAAGFTVNIADVTVH